MNKARRKAIQKTISDIEQVVQAILDDEQDAYDNMPEGLQESTNGIISIEAQENLEAAIESLEDAISYLEEVC